MDATVALTKELAGHIAARYAFERLYAGCLKAKPDFLE